MSETNATSGGDDRLAGYHRKARAKILRRAAEAGPAFLHATTNGRYLQVEDWYWTTGFWPGMLRLVLNEIDDTDSRRFAGEIEDRLFGILQTEGFEHLNHDVGFQFIPTSVMRYRQTGDAEARRRGLVSASLLMGRYNPASGILEAWNSPSRRGICIIDCLMNVPLLFWASEVTGEPRFANLAIAHIDTSLPHFMQDDDTVRHAVRFDQLTGEKIGPIEGQGFAPHSAWARGQGWAIYGLAIASRYTGRRDYLDLSRKIADRFLDLNASHGVPPWDFRVDNVDTAPRDSSAAAIVACGLLELADLGDPVARNQAADLILTLSERAADFGTETDALLRDATSDLPLDIFVSSSLIYGDFYYYEALQRLSGINRTCW